MAYDKALAERVRTIVKDLDGYSAKEMFGGIGFMLHENMSCGVTGADLIVRVGPDAYDQALSQDHVREFDMTGRPMRGWVVVQAEAFHSQEELEAWLQRGTRFAQSLPPK